LKGALHAFDAQARSRIEAAIQEAESHTAAEIVPVVSHTSSRYQRAEDVMGLWCAFIAYVLLGIFSPENLIDFWEGLIVLGLAVGLGAFLAHAIPALKRGLAGKTEQQEQVMDAAFRSFRSFGVGDTTGRTGVLIFLSLFERMVVVIGDRSLTDKLTPADYSSVRDAVLEHLRQGNPVEGLAAAIRQAGSLLARALPRPAGDRDEIPNTLRVLE
jgi:putative membrane protein